MIQVPGRLHPIQLVYKPIPVIEKSTNTDKLNPAPYVRILQLIDTKYPPDERGDLLIFLSGIKEITTVVDACREYAERNKKWIVLPLHSTLSLSDQDKVFDYPPEGVRKCIVSTNIAETSITIDGVRFVLDSGKVKEMQYDTVCKMQRLKEFWISQASAEQRKGRAGRTGPGVCFRLFEESEYAAMNAYSTPEIHRAPLDGTVLQMVAMGLNDARKFPFVESPAPETLENAIMSLKEVGAMNHDESLTITGRMLSKLPVDVNVGKMLMMGTLFHQVESVLTIASALSVQSPFTNNAYKDQDCVAARKNLDSDHGDPITLLNAYREWLLVKAKNEENSRRWCRKRGLEEQRFYEMTKLHHQFKDILLSSGLLRDSSEVMQEMTSSERATRHGELKKLKSLKREYQAKEGSKKKKFFSMRDVDTAGLSGMDNDLDDSLDIKDIEFRMRNDHRKVQNLLESSKAYSYKDLTILKLILCSGLYPQFAIADEFNHAKGGPDQLFHTRVKPFNVLHPNCIFASTPEYLQLEEIDKIHVPGFHNQQQKYPFSSKHQILVYMSLLETNKPYVVNATRMPALQVLLLFCHVIETNMDFSRMVFDSWLEVQFANETEAQIQVTKAFLLREIWSELSNLRLEDSLMDSGPRDESRASRQHELEFLLSNGLVDFVHTETLFSMRRLLPGDLKVIYNGQKVKNVSCNPIDDMATHFTPIPNSEKGGIQLSNYLLYNCLENEAHVVSRNISSSWICSFCEESGEMDILVRMQHLACCLKQKSLKIASENRKEKDIERQKANPNASEYECTVCSKTFHFTPMQLLRHKKSHECNNDLSSTS